MGVQIDVQLSLNFDQIRADVKEGLTAGETKAAERLLALSLPRTPIDLGTLRETGAVVPATDPSEGAAVTFDTPYAARLHEHPEYHFQEPGTGAKYLEDPAVENRAELGGIIAKEVSGA